MLLSLGSLDPVEYARELRRQVEEREKETKKKKEEQERYDKQKEEECANYNPWGRGGAGAPLKDAQVIIIFLRVKSLPSRNRNYYVHYVVCKLLKFTFKSQIGHM